MAAFRIFYAWQSDRPAKLCRSLIRNALDDAAQQLQDDLAIDDAPDIEIDQDTQGEPGSPAVAETICRKIRESDAFVADLTFAGKRANEQESPVPNPNVLIEYGYALHALGHERVIAVFNEEFGNRKDLPFDISHRCWPIAYRTSGAGSDERAKAARRDERRKLAGELVKAIKAILQGKGKREGDSGAVPARPLVEEFPLASGLVRPSSGQKIEFPEGAKVLLSFRSTFSNLSLKNVEVQRIVQKSLKPLSWKRSKGWSKARVAEGAAVVVLPNDDESRELTASILLRDGSMYGIDCDLVGLHEWSKFSEPFVPSKALEEILMEGFGNFLEVAESTLKLALPLEVGVALEGVREHYLAVDPAKFFNDLHGPLVKDRIEDRFQIYSYTVDPVEVLTPFFKEVYDEAGLERP
ncbi:MAG: nucleotide-binding protein [Albidovulum sp.]|nr:nucleotide-binding protein [Albidovulum sp.]